MSLRRSGVFRVPPLRRTSDDVIDVNVISTPDSRLLYLSIMRFGAAKDTEITGIEPCWLVNWRHQTRRRRLIAQLQPALLRLSAITSQFFIRLRAIALMIMSVGLDCGFEFEKAGNS